MLHLGHAEEGDVLSLRVCVTSPCRNDRRSPPTYQRVGGSAHLVAVGHGEAQVVVGVQLRDMVAKVHGRPAQLPTTIRYQQTIAQLDLHVDSVGRLSVVQVGPCTEVRLRSYASVLCA